jgi:hypothetical protein
MAAMEMQKSRNFPAAVNTQPSFFRFSCGCYHQPDRKAEPYFVGSSRRRTTIALVSRQAQCFRTNAWCRSTQSCHDAVVHSCVWIGVAELFCGELFSCAKLDLPSPQNVNQNNCQGK